MPHPDTATPIDLAQQAITLLADPTDANLRAARSLLQQATREVPYLDAAPYCHEFRARVTARYCTDWRICGRCRPIHDANDDD